MKHKKLATIIEGILFVTLMLSSSAMDSTNMVIPVVGCLVSAIGLLAMSRMEGNR